MRVLAVLILLPLLAGCSGMDVGDLFSFGHSDDQPVSRPAAVATAAPVVSQTTSFCMAVAQKDATTNGFDAATQQRVAARSYQQCVAIFGNSIN